eukprot:GHVT01070679.1.p1 GENE.GHVT01070679.1~~GHVT01070679.1.p1  ORF type:complete len:441 (-),score=8.38 GHVT01070679.1:180-1502(-)
MGHTRSLVAWCRGSNGRPAHFFVNSTAGPCSHTSQYESSRSYYVHSALRIGSRIVQFNPQQSRRVLQQRNSNQTIWANFSPEIPPTCAIRHNKASEIIPRISIRIRTQNVNMHVPNFRARVLLQTHAAVPPKPQTSGITISSHLPSSPRKAVIFFPTLKPDCQRVHPWVAVPGSSHRRHYDFHELPHFLVHQPSARVFSVCSSMLTSNVLGSVLPCHRILDQQRRVLFSTAVNPPLKGCKPTAVRHGKIKDVRSSSVQQATDFNEAYRILHGVLYAGWPSERLVRDRHLLELLRLSAHQHPKEFYGTFTKLLKLMNRMFNSGRHFDHSNFGTRIFAFLFKMRRQTKCIEFLHQHSKFLRCAPDRALVKCFLDDCYDSGDISAVRRTFAAIREDWQMPLCSDDYKTSILALLRLQDPDMAMDESLIVNLAFIRMILGVLVN